MEDAPELSAEDAEEAPDDAAPLSVGRWISVGLESSGRKESLGTHEADDANGIEVIETAEAAPVIPEVTEQIERDWMGKISIRCRETVGSRESHSPT
jgi:hypothetical protein